jgi:hypothetical protein
VQSPIVKVTSPNMKRSRAAIVQLKAVAPPAALSSRRNVECRFRVTLRPEVHTATRAGVPPAADVLANLCTGFSHRKSAKILVYAPSPLGG